MLSPLSCFQRITLQNGYLTVNRKADELSYSEFELYAGKWLNFVSPRLQMGKLYLLEFTLDYPL